MEKVKEFFARLAADLHPLNRDLEDVTDRALTWLANLPYNWIVIAVGMAILYAL